MTRHSKVFVPVSTDERFPNKYDDFIVTQREGGYATTWEFDGEEEDFKKWVTHWLEEKENVYVLTEDEYYAIEKENKELKEKVTELETVIAKLSHKILNESNY